MTIKKNISKLMVVVALVLTVMFTAGVSDELLDTGITSQANAGCIGGGSTTSSGGGC